MSHRKDQNCLGCGARIRKGKTGYCCHCWPKRIEAQVIKYPWTAEWDAMLREGYARCVLGKPTVAIDRVQSVTGYPRYIVRLRAQKLGITRDTRRPWTVYEVNFLRQHAGKMTTRRIAETLGRSFESVGSQMDLLELKRAIMRGYSIAQLADLIGVSDHQVRKFIHRGWLIYDADHRIPKGSVRRFLISHMDFIDLRLMNQKWLKDELRRALEAVTGALRRAA